MIRSLLTYHFSNNLIRPSFRMVVSVRRYPRRSQPTPPSSYLQMSEDEDVLDETEISSHLDIMEDHLHVESFDKERHAKAQRQWLKNKIIKKKYFKEDQELNLLSWNAKEQMRYLHDKDPDEWSVANLAQSFPVSEEGVIKILRSSYNPHTQKEIDQHDIRVHKNWLKLRSYMRELDGAVEPLEGGPIAHTAQKLIETAKLPLMINAGGINNVSLPQTKPRIFEKKKVGTFEAIVKDYVENERKIRHDKKMSFPLDECQPLLKDISKCSPVKSETMTKRFFIENKTTRDFRKTGESKIIAGSRRGRKLVESLKKGTLGSSLLENSNMMELGMQGTGVTGDTHHSKKNTEHYLESTNKYNEHDFTKTDNSRMQQDKENWRFESQRRKGCYDATQNDEYGSESGYPLEQAGKELDKLDVPKSLKNKGDLYQKGNHVYDEDGEFLYKIP